MLKRHLTRHPRAFDKVKRVTRALGVRSAVYRFLRDFDRRYPHCRFLQIGSNDGMRHDPLREFVVRGRWSGVLVEPVPWMFEALVRNYRGVPGLAFERVAVSDTIGRASFHVVRESRIGAFHEAASMVGSFDPAHVARNVSAAEDGDIMAIDVATVTVDALLAKHGMDEIDLLHIDAEGHEPTILGSIDFTRVRPKAIIYESRHLADDPVDDMLKAAGYEIRSADEDSIATLT